MGAVHRATDTKLGRDVAINPHPAGFAEDSGRMRRFEREAQVLASLNHPNIAAIWVDPNVFWSIFSWGRMHFFVLSGTGLSSENHGCVVSELLFRDASGRAAILRQHVT